MQFATINNITFHYEISGPVTERPVLVLANSLGTDLRIWDAVVARIGPGATILRYDMRGHGLSDSGPGPAAIADHAGDLAGLLDHLRIRSAVVCGLSVGGMVAMSLHAQRPDLVRALVLCDTAPNIGTAESWDARIAAVEICGLDGILDAVMERWFTADFRRVDNPLYAGCRAMLARQPASGYVAMCMALRNADLTAQARAIDVPTLCVVGAQDGSTPPDLVAGMAALIPEARFEIIPDAGHIPCVEQPDALCSLLRAALSEWAAPQHPARAGRYEAGMATRRSVLGAAHVDRAQAAATEFDRPFQELITEGAWGTVWSRATLTKRDRSLITLALLAALNQHDEFAMHVRATANTGATRDEVCDALLHVATYAGVPAANHAFKLAKHVYAHMDNEMTV